MDFDLGTDPESVLQIVATGKIRTAKDVITDVHKNNGIGLDGERPTASIEFRPGIAKTGEDLVNALAVQINTLRNHYKPKGVIYRAGAWVTPEPLGGHIHFSWPATLELGASEVHNILNGWKYLSNYLNPRFFDETELKKRINHAKHYGKDFAKPMAFRAGEQGNSAQGGSNHGDPDKNTIVAALRTRHFEYRYPPSWLLTPEMAYCYLGGAEVVARRVIGGKFGTEMRWPKFIERMFTGDVSPPNGPSLSDAFNVAVKFTDWNTDYTDNWVA